MSATNVVLAPAEEARSQPPQPAWRIMEYEGQAKSRRFAVFRERARLAWGLRDREAAVRWIVRLGGAPPLFVSEDAAGDHGQGRDCRACTMVTTPESVKITAAP
ncbi:MAG TPA: hypothetical protein VHS99_08240 [Chloroflexota bacterium]|jgi:hypothetical protein|nr:hypothetical protein [Chloroflexota bacterium]